MAENLPAGKIFLLLMFSDRHPCVKGTVLLRFYWFATHWEAFGGVCLCDNTGGAGDRQTFFLGKVARFSRPIVQGDISLMEHD